MRVRVWMLSTVMFGVIIAGAAGHAFGSAPVIGAGTPCVQASPSDVVATPDSATPAATCLSGPVADLGTPVTTDGLTIELQISSDQAGPVTVTVTVSTAKGEPVTDAKVNVTQRHLEMDMGARLHDAAPTTPGVYVADDLGMGMGGAWLVEVDIDRPGQPRVVAYFLVEMRGPK